MGIADRRIDFHVNSIDGEAMKLEALATLLLASSATLIGQQPATQLTFDVISIKPSQSTTAGGGLRNLVRMAYQRFGFDPREIVGGPSWIDSERFDIIATAERPPADRPDGFPEELLAMIRALVEDRFKVAVHNEQRGAPIYAMVLARGDGKTGTSLHQVPDACPEAMKGDERENTAKRAAALLLRRRLWKTGRNGCDVDNVGTRPVQLRWQDYRRSHRTRRQLQHRTDVRPVIRGSGSSCCAARRFPD
jgi:uncharacterized protein (TIGR03435 family)